MIALIPARGGSKGVPNKNKRIVGGLPLIAHTIMAAQKALSIERIIVTTDDKEIAKIAVDYGAEVPFIRPEELSEDNSSAVDVYIHAVEYLMDTEKIDISKFVVLLPTAPLRTSKHIDEAVEMFERSAAETLVSIVEIEVSPKWNFILTEDNRIKNANFIEAKSLTNRQNDEKYYILNGAIYILDYSILKNKRTYFTNNTVGYLMKQEDSIDIDTKMDLKMANYILSNCGEDKE